MPATFTTAPSYGPRLMEEPNVLINTFGDGYEARQGDGINTIKMKWSLIFEHRTSVQAKALVAFFRKQKGVTAFNWTPPDEVQGLYVARNWTKTPIQFDDYMVTVEFHEVIE